MLTGPDLGKAIKKALELKGIKGPTKVAKMWGVKPPSVSGWFDNGRIQTDKLLQIMDLCADECGPDHWGLKNFPGQSREKVLRANEPVDAYNVEKTNPKNDPITVEVISIMESTDAQGRAMALGAVKSALHNYRPAKANKVA